MSVTSVDRSFRILRLLAEGPLTLSELARSVEMPMSTASRFLSSLRAAGAVARNEHGLYRIGPTIHELAGETTGAYDLLALASTHISALARSTGETAGIAAASGDDVLHLGQVSSDTEVTVRDWTGVQVPAHSGCTGFVIMAYWPPSQIDAYLDTELEAFSDASVTDGAQIRERLDVIRDQGYLWTSDEYATDITSVAAPVRDRTGQAVASLHMWGPSYRFPEPGTEAGIADELVSRARTLASVLGHDLEVYKSHDSRELGMRGQEPAEVRRSA